MYSDEFGAGAVAGAGERVGGFVFVMYTPKSTRKRKKHCFLNYEHEVKISVQIDNTFLKVLGGRYTGEERCSSPSRESRCS